MPCRASGHLHKAFLGRKDPNDFLNGPKDRLKNNLNAVLPGSAPSRIQFSRQEGPKPSAIKLSFYLPNGVPDFSHPTPNAQGRLNAARSRKKGALGAKKYRARCCEAGLK